MRFHIFNRKFHYWAAGIVALPALLVFCSGLLLQVKKQVPWVQPPEQRATAGVPALALTEVLERARAVPGLNISSWQDIERVDLRPARNLIKITTRERYEIQMDATTGAVLQVAQRRSDWIESLHDGSWFGDWAKSWIFLPIAITLLLVLLSGLWLFWHKILQRRKRPASQR